MKKIGLIVCFLCLLTGCAKQDKERKNQLEVAGKAYYETYGSKYTVDEYTVTLKELKQAKKELKQDYDLSALEKCQDDTKVQMTIKNKKVEKVEIKLNCRD